MWNRVTKTDGCWIWNGPTSNGYGTVCLDSKNVMIHRFVYELLIGEIPKGMQLDHLCRVRNCVNPNHLEVVTIKENVLRGEGFSAKNLRKTHCNNGHEFTVDNTYIRPDPDNSRECRVCSRRHWQKSNEKRRLDKLKLRGEIQWQHLQ